MKKWDDCSSAQPSTSKSARKKHQTNTLSSPREILNVVHAQQAGCAIITLTPELLVKMKNFGKSLKLYSLETVRMLTGDAIAAGFSL